ncbi:hypothetical protein HYU06_03960 [Candidatus Woesearchaeota archaeon]|nr:hypothetical protein [Candidatus Woesearchaeota archaeon]
MNKRGFVFLLFIIALAFISFNAENAVSLGSGNNTLINISIFDTSDSFVVYHSNFTFFYANVTNVTTGIVAVTQNASCNITLTLNNEIANPINMTWNSTLNYYTYNTNFSNARVGVQKFNITCLYNGILIDVQDNFTITNRVPAQASNLPNLSLFEEETNLSINLYDYFTDGDAHVLNYSMNQSGSALLLNVYNTTYLNVTGNRDFYGYTNFLIIVYDGYGENLSTNIIFVNVTNRPEVNLSNPVDGSTVANRNTAIEFRSIVEDIYSINNCTLYGNFSGSFAANQTVTNPNISSLQEIKDDDGSSDNNHQVGQSTVGTVTKLYNISLGQTIYQVEFYVLSQGTPSQDLIVWLNGDNQFNITDAEINSCSSEPCWITKTVTNTSIFRNGTNNVTLNSTRTLANHYKIYIDTNNDYGRSLNSVNGDITGEYMIRLVNSTNIVTFNSMTLSKGGYLWNTKCYNNRDVYKLANTNFTLNVLNSVPSTPTVSPSSGTYDDQINISCASTDADNDNLTYNIQYFPTFDINNIITVSEEDDDGNYTWNTTLLQNNLTIKVKCQTSDGTNSSSTASSTGIITIYHPVAPTIPVALQCNTGNCSRIFNETINLTANGTTDINNQFTYYFEALYDDVNGSNYYFLGNIGGLNSTNSTGTIAWNITSIFAQTITLRVLASDGTYNSSYLVLTNNATINNTNAPSIATGLSPNNGTFNISQNIVISTNGSTDPNGDILIYRIYAYYDSSWHLINGTMNNASIFSWNFSNVVEQNINLSTQVTDNRYVSPILRTNAITLVKPPTIATNITPTGNDASNVYEYSLNYSCSFRTLNSTYPGTLPVNVSELAYDDGSYWTASSGTKKFAVNISNYDYDVCFKGYTSSGTITVNLYWDCPSTYETNVCYGNLQQTINSSNIKYCKSSNLTRAGLKYGKISLSGTGYAYIDSVILTAKANTFNLTNITPQKNVQLRCKAQDDAGDSPYLYSNNTIIIDRIPTYSGLYNYNFTRTQNLTLNISTLFSDPDGTRLNFTINNLSAPKSILTYNFSNNYNLTIADNGSKGYDYLTFYADDGLVNKTVNITFFINSCGDNVCNFDETCGTTNNYNANTTYECNRDCNICISQSPGGGSSGGAAGALTASSVATPPPAVPIPPAAPPPAPAPSGSSEQKPVIEEKPVEIKPSALTEARKISVISRKYPEPQILFGTTKVFETIKNIDIYTVDDIKVKVTIPKDIIKTTDELAKDDTYYVIEKDPVIEFPLGTLEPREEKVISYTLKKEIKKEFITDNIFKVEISSRTLSAEEVAKRAKEKEERIKKAKEVVNVSVSYNISKEGKAEITIDVKLLNKTLKAKGLSILSAIPKCLIAKLDEEFKKKSLKSDIDFDVLKADPLTQLNLGDIDEDRQFKITIDRIADINCDDPIEQEAIVREIVPDVARVAGKVNYLRAITELLGYLALVFIWWKISTLEPEKTSSYKRFLSKKYSIFSLLFIFLVLNILDVLGRLPADLAFYKNITSFIAVGYTIYKVSITKVLFGEEHKHIDLGLVFAFFLILAKATVATLRNTFKESELSTHLVLAILQITALEEILLSIGAVIFFIIALYLSRKIIVNELSLVSLILKPANSKGTLASVWKFIVMFGLLGIFYVAIYQLAMEWFTIVIDSVVMIVIALVLMAIALKHHHKANVGETLEESESAVEIGYRRFFKLFRFHKTAFLGLAFISTAFIVTEIFVYIVPYSLGLEQAEIYLGGLESGHQPLFSLLGKSLFTQNIVGLPLHGMIFIAAIYLLNILGIFLLLGIPMFILYHVTKHIDKPIKHIPKSDLPTWAVAIFIASVAVMLFIPVFKIQRFNSENVAGVDIQTNFISTHFIPNLLGVLVAAVILGYLILNFIRKSIRIGNKRREHHYVIGAGTALLCLGYIFSYISYLLYGRVLFIEDVINNYETSYLMFVVLLALAVGYLVYYYTQHSKRHEMLFEYIALGSVIMFFAVYYYIYVSDIIANHWHLLISQVRVLEFSNGFGVRIYLRAFVLLFTGMLYLFEFFIYTGSFLAFIYILYSRNELGVHKYNLPFLKKIDQMYDLRHATAEIIKYKKILDTGRLKKLEEKLRKGIEIKKQELQQKIRNNPEIDENAEKKLAAEQIIGHLIDHDWHINDIYYAVIYGNFEIEEGDNLLRALYNKYSEEISLILEESKPPINIAQDLALFDCPTEHIYFEIDNSALALSIKEQITSELGRIKKLQHYYSSKIEKALAKDAEKQKLLEQRPEQSCIAKIAAAVPEPDKAAAQASVKREQKAFEKDKKAIDKILHETDKQLLTGKESGMFKKLEHGLHEPGHKTAFDPDKAYAALFQKKETSRDLYHKALSITKNIELGRKDRQLFRQDWHLDKLNVDKEYKKLSKPDGFFYRAKTGILSHIADKKLALNKKRISKIKRLVMERLSQRHVFGLIISSLESSGYNMAEINTALFELGHEPEYHLLLQKAEYNNDADALNAVKNLKLSAVRKQHIGQSRKFIEAGLKFMKLHRIVSLLLAKGWKEEDIAEVIKDLKLGREEDRLIQRHIKGR